MQRRPSGLKLLKFLSSNKFQASYLQPREANYAPLTPLLFLHRAAKIYHDKTCYLIHDSPVSWKQALHRIQAFAHILSSQFAIQPYDVVSVLSPNTYAFFELHYSVPGIRAVLHSINIRLDAASIAFQLQHSESKLLLVDVEFMRLAESALQLLPPETKPRIICIPAPDAPGGSQQVNQVEYEDLVKQGDPNFTLQHPENDFDAMTLNYTSGTTGLPKGVVTHYRGMYLTAMSVIVDFEVPKFFRQLPLVPMFHCNGWCSPYAAAISGATSYFLRHISAKAVFDIMQKWVPRSDICVFLL